MIPPKRLASAAVELCFAFHFSHPFLARASKFKMVFRKKRGNFASSASALPGQDGLFELGVEILHPVRNFWGIAFPDEHVLG